MDNGAMKMDESAVTEITERELLAACQARQVILQQLADAVDGNVGGRIFSQGFGIVGIVALAGEDRGYLCSPDLFDGAEDAQLVIDEHIVRGGEASFHVVQLLLLMDINQNVAIHSFPDA